MRLYENLDVRDIPRTVLCKNKFWLLKYTTVSVYKTAI